MKAWLNNFYNVIVKSQFYKPMSKQPKYSEMNEELAICKADIEFVEQMLPRLRGWLFPEAAYMTCHLLRKQTEWGIKGSGIEIGVYEGRYLSLIHRLLAERSDKTIGIDTFQFIPQNEVAAALSAVLGSSTNLPIFVERDSATISPAELFGWVQGRPVVISVDGDHSAAAVKRDLMLADDVLGDGGLVIVDDFLNHFAIGVTEGVYAYLAEKTTRLVPCIFIGQKLIFCRASDTEKYRSEAFLFGQNAMLKICEGFRAYLRRAQAYVEPEIAGHKVVMFVSPHCDATYGQL